MRDEPRKERRDHFLDACEVHVDDAVERVAGKRSPIVVAGISGDGEHAIQAEVVHDAKHVGARALRIGEISGDEPNVDGMHERQVSGQRLRGPVRRMRRG